MTPLSRCAAARRGEAYNEKVDIFSLGIILLEAFLGDPRYILNHFRSSGSGLSVVEKYQKGIRPDIPDAMRKKSPSISRLIEDCWAADFYERPDASEASVAC